MDALSFYNSDLFKWIILPVLIFCARLLDVGLGTLRIMFVARGLKYVAPIVGFIEINIWLLAIGQIIQNLNNIMCYIAYAGGFASGTFIGMLLDERLCIGKVLVRVISRRNTNELVASLKETKYNITVVDAESSKGPVKIIFANIDREDLADFLNRVHTIHPQTFYSVEDVRQAGEVIFPYRRHLLFQTHRKGK